MSDVVSYLLLLGAVVVGGFVIIRVAIAILRDAYLNQSLVYAFPFV